MATETELRNAVVTYEFLRWLLQHGILLKSTDDANNQALEKFLVEHELPFTLPNLCAAWNSLVAVGHQFTVDVIPAAAAPVKAPKPLPEVPPYMDGVRTKQDVLKCPKYSEWMKGKHGHLFKARVAEILLRAAAEEK